METPANVIGSMYGAETNIVRFASEGKFCLKKTQRHPLL